jgi:hypothetical protein
MLPNDVMAPSRTCAPARNVAPPLTGKRLIRNSQLLGAVLAQAPKEKKRQGRARRIRPGRLLGRAHMHPKSAFIYTTVLEGAIRSQVNDGPVTIYTAGPRWSEQPGDRHRVSANASETEPARLLAVFVVETNETELVIPLGN